MAPHRGAVTSSIILFGGELGRRARPPRHTPAMWHAFSPTPRVRSAGLRAFRALRATYAPPNAVAIAAEEDIAAVDEVRDRILRRPWRR